MISLSPEQQEAFSRKPLLAIFDRDGTLAPITADPNGAPVPAQICELLQALSKCPNVVTGILSARSCRQLSADFGDNGLVLGGNYGLEISYPQLQKFIHPQAKDSLAKLNEVRNRLHQTIGAQWQTILEDHGLTLCWHWHLTPPDWQQAVHNTLDGIKQEFPELLFQTLPTSYEIWPMINWDKSWALDEMERSLCGSTENWAYFYAGDSDKDEPAFDWVNKRQGVSVKVGNQLPTLAQHSMVTHQELADFMTELVRLRQSQNA